MPIILYLYLELCKQTITRCVSITNWPTPEWKGSSETERGGSRGVVGSASSSIGSFSKCTQLGAENFLQISQVGDRMPATWAINRTSRVFKSSQQLRLAQPEVGMHSLTSIFLGGPVPIPLGYPWKSRPWKGKCRFSTTFLFSSSERLGFYYLILGNLVETLFEGLNNIALQFTICNPTSKWQAGEGILRFNPLNRKVAIRNIARGRGLDMVTVILAVQGGRTLKRWLAIQRC